MTGGISAKTRIGRTGTPGVSSSLCQIYTQQYKGTWVMEVENIENEGPLSHPIRIAAT